MAANGKWVLKSKLQKLEDALGGDRVDRGDRGRQGVHGRQKTQE